MAGSDLRDRLLLGAALLAALGAVASSALAARARSEAAGLREEVRTMGAAVQRLAEERRAILVELNGLKLEVTMLEAALAARAGQAGAVEVTPGKDPPAMDPGAGEAPEGAAR